MENNEAKKIDLRTGEKHTGEKQPRKPYFKPVLIILGDLQSLTLGPSIGIYESGYPTTKDPYFG
jgi:hypothetical protein